MRTLFPLAAVLLLDTDEEIGHLTELLDVYFTKAEGGQITPHLTNITRGRSSDLNHDTALKVDAIIQTARHEQSN